jgi:hypothetical protein
MFVAFWSFGFRRNNRRESSPGRAVLATFGTKNLAVEFSATNAPNPPRLTKTHVCCVFGVSVFDGNNVAKLALEGRFSDFWNKKTRSWIFRNERTQSTPFDQNS